jgi:hypothetical protein
VSDPILFGNFYQYCNLWLVEVDPDGRATRARAMAVIASLMIWLDGWLDETMSGRKHRKPTFAECMQMMRQRDPQVRENGFHALLGYQEHLDALVRELEIEADHGLRCWLLELIGETRCPDAVPVLAEYLTSEDESFRDWAVAGLQAIDTKEARRMLWEAQPRQSRPHADPSDTPYWSSQKSGGRADSLTCDPIRMATTVLPRSSIVLTYRSSWVVWGQAAGPPTYSPQAVSKASSGVVAAKANGQAASS